MSLRTELASLHMHIAVSLDCTVRKLTSAIHCEARQVSSIEENAIGLFQVGEVLVFMAL